uniref:acyl-CoA dehydrogenase family protein n=1 Tax=Acinetobacter baumannii TaxID=470 RepID=UPI00148D8141
MSEDAGAIRDSARDFLNGAYQRARVRALAAHAPPAGFDRAYWRQMADLGWFLLTVPEADGGLGLTLSEAALIAEEAGRALLPEPFAACGV